MAETPLVETTFRITTYWKRPRGQPGITQLASRRLTPAEALQWVLDELPEDAVSAIPGTGTLLVLTIDAAKLNDKTPGPA